MTPAAGLLGFARSIGVRVEANGPKLRIVPPLGIDSRDWMGLVEGLAEFKAEVLARLAATSPTWSSPDCPAFADDEALTIEPAECDRIVADVARYHA